MENQKIKRHAPIRVVINGRVSNTMNGKTIDLDKLFIPVIKDYLSSVLPRLNPDTDLDISINCTQYSKREHWYTPRDERDVPDSKELFAADTALCVNHGCMTFCEKLALLLEQSFWNYSELGYAFPKYHDVGQDIKVMISRINKNITATICMPVYKDIYSSIKEYEAIVKKHEKRLLLLAKGTDINKEYNIQVEINRMPDNTYRNYSLVIGSCIECGEEGVVGRGNNVQGLISSFREHTVEAPCGKNMRYHTGRVVNYMGINATTRIYSELKVKSTLYSLTRNRGSITNPFLFYLSVDDLSKMDECKKIIEEEFNEKSLKNITVQRNLY